MKKSLLSLPLLLVISLPSYAQADDLAEVYQLALENDPVTLRAKAQKESAMTGIDSSRSALLPQISLSISAFQDGMDSDNSGNSASVSLNQSLYSAANWAGLARAELVASRFDSSYAQAKQNLILRTVSAYFNVLQAQDDLAFARAEKKAIERQLEQTKQRFQVGLTAITDVHEAQAQFDTSVAAEIAALNAVEINREALREITGIYHKNLAILDRTKFSASMPSPGKIQEWLTMSEQRNLQLLAAKIDVDIAKEDISLASAAYYPTVSLSASATSNDSDLIKAVSDDRQNTSSIGISVNVPLYQGGRLNAGSDAARADFVAASESLEQTYRSVVRSVRTNFYDVRASIARIRALQQAVVSARSALKATEAGFEVGTRTIVDVLNSTRNLFDARRNLAQVRYGYVISVLNLKLAGGNLSEQDVIDINAGLKSLEELRRTK